jgi:hypothetical protein
MDQLIIILLTLTERVIAHYLPGDLIYKDLNGDNVIDYQDTRPIGYGYGTQPTTNFGCQ